MIYILHISDLHFVKNAATYNTEEILLREASEKVRNVPKGKKLLIVTGDFHNFEDEDYYKAEEFLKRLVSQMDLEMKQDVFVIPGNHDVGNDTALEPLLQPIDSNWKSHQKSCLKMLKDGDKAYIEERLLIFLPYNTFLQNLGVYDVASDEKYPARSHVRCWRDTLNILHLNTALIADGTKKDEQMTDVDAAANPKTWEPYYDAKIPSIAIGHNNYYDIKEDQRHDLAGTFALRNVSAYLCGDRHQIERNPEYRTIPIQPEPKHDIRIPNLVAARSVADGDDDYSEVGFCWHYWNEESDEVSVEFRKWTKYTGGKTEREGEGRKYDMRHEKPVMPDLKGKNPVEITRLNEEKQRILIITALEIGYKSVLKTLVSPFISLKQEILDGRIYYVFDYLSGLTVICTSYMEFWETNTKFTISNAIKTYNVDTVILTGTCWGLDESMNYGDIIISNQIVNYEFDKKDAGLICINDSYRISIDYELVQRMSQFKSERWINYLNQEYPKKSNSKRAVYTGTVLSGITGISNNEAELIKKMCRKALAIEMEGFYSSVSGILRHMKNPPSFIIVEAIGDIWGIKYDDFRVFCSLGG